jgi:hypothetical protein
MNSYICIGTIPNRVHLLEPIIKNILLHNLNKNIIISIPQYYVRGGQKFDGKWPKNLLTLQDKGLIILNISQEDYGPATKFIAACRLIEDEKAKLIICDDDNILDGPFADELLRNHSEYEFLGYSGIKIIKRFLKRNSYQFIEKNNSDKLEVDILQGYAGFIFDRLMISDNFLEFYDNLAYQFKSNPTSLTKALFLNDDVTLSLYMKSKMFVTHQFGNEFFNTGHIKSLSQSKIDALHQNNIFGSNFASCDAILKNQNAFFKLIK